MKQIDRLLTKALTIRLSHGDSVFIISNETGEWTADGEIFPSMEAAEEYVGSLLPDDADSTVIINDVGPCDTDILDRLTTPDNWLERIIEENRERIRQEWEAERLNAPPEKDRRLI